MSKYAIYINSGAGGTTYTDGSNISHLEINNSDDQYYQTGLFSTFGNTSHDIGDTVLVMIDDTQQFTGYISRTQQEILMGKLVNTYQLIGKTYDLWRYNTGDSTLFTGNTAYIASSLVATYVDGMTAPVDTSLGIEITNEIDLVSILPVDITDAISKRYIKLNEYKNEFFQKTELNIFLI